MPATTRTLGSFWRLAGGLGVIALAVLALTVGVTHWTAVKTTASTALPTAPIESSAERDNGPSPARLAPPAAALHKVDSLKRKKTAQSNLPTISPALALEVSTKEPQAEDSKPVADGQASAGEVVVARDTQCWDIEKDEGNLRRVMGWSRRTLSKAQTLTGLSPQDLCALPLAARDQLRSKVKEVQGADANGMIEYLNSRHLDETGKVPADGLFKAVQQHKALLQKQARTLKRAGISSSLWTAMGPKNTYSGRVNALHIDPRNATMMLAGAASGGLWRTTDAGTTWLPIDSFSPAFTITGLSSDPNNPDTIYASTGEGYSDAGIWQSLDNGATWQGIPSIAPGQYIPGRTAGSDWMNVGHLPAVAVSPISSQIIVVAADNGVLVTRDGGATWQQVAPRNVATTYMLSTFFVSFDPKDGRKVFVGTNRGTVVVGTGIGTGSEQWQEQAIVVQTSGSMALVTAMAWSKDGSSAWLTTSEAQGTVYRSIDGGFAFAKLSTPGYCGIQCGYNNALWVDPTNSNRIVIGGISAYRSVDGGTTWGEIGFGLNWTQLHPDVHTIFADPSYNGTTNRTVYVGNDGGVYRSTDITAPAWTYSSGVSNTPANAFTWENFGKGIDATQFYAIDSNSNAGIITGGTQDNGTFRYQSGTDWTSIDFGDGGYPGVPNSGTPLYTSQQYFVFRRTPQNAASTYTDNFICDGITDSDATYRSILNPTTETYETTLICGVAGQRNKSLFIAPIILDPNNDKRMYAGGASLWASNDVSTGIPVWRAIKGALPPDQYGNAIYVSSIAVAPGDANSVWVGYTNGAAYRTSNALATVPTWVLVRSVLPNSWGQVSSIYISPTSPQRVTISLSGYASGLTAKNVLRTVDAGTNWSDISGNLPKSVAYTVVEHPTNPNSLYVGTDTGIYATTDGITWSASNDGPALVPVFMLKWYDNSTLLAATYGRGVWRVTVGNMAPGGPTLVTGSPGNAQVTVTFAAPLSDGGSPITGYTVTSSPTGGIDINAGTIALTHTITGLGNGVAYTFTVKARNALGEGAVSAPSAIVVPAETLIPAAERTALLNLYASTNGPSWTNKANWGGPGYTECTWFGVTCDKGQTHITRIELSNNNLGGSLPALSGLTALQYFEVGNNKLTGSIPSLSGLAALYWFSVANNLLSGSIPSLSGLTALQIFAVGFNQLTGPIPALSGLTALSWFGVSSNQLTGAVPSLSGLTALYYFSVGGNQLTGVIPSLSGLTGLFQFDAGFNQLYGTIPSLAGLTALKYFSVSSNQLSGPVPSAPSSLIAGGSSLCSNRLVSSGSPTIDAAWATATGGNWLACQTVGSLITQTISFINPGVKTLGAAPFTLSATGGASGNAVTFTSLTTSVCTVSGSTVTLVAAGVCTLAANQAGNATYAAASRVLQSFSVVGVISQTISFSSPGAKTMGAAPFALSAAGGASGNPVTFTSQTTGVCTVSGNTVTLVAAGTCTVAANQAGNANYAAAPQVTQSITVSAAPPTSAAGPYDGIYQWSSGNYLSLHQDGTHMIATIYFNADGNFSFPATSGTGVLPVPQLDIFDLMNGQVNGSTVRMNGTRFHRACNVTYDFTFNPDTTITVTRVGVSNTAAADAAGISCSAIVGAEPSTLGVPKIRFNPDSTPVANVGLYDGIYQWSSGNYLSLHQDGTLMIATIYFNADGSFSFPAASGTGVLSVPQLDIFDLMNGQVIGSTVAMNGTRFHRACNATYNFTFNGDDTITVTRSGVGNTAAADAAGIACSAIVGAEPATLSVPKIRFN